MFDSPTSWGALALTATHLMLASVVTAHILLHKRDIGGAIGWIGLAWLSPFLGSVLYYTFGINRVKRRGRRPRNRWRVHHPVPSTNPSTGRADHLTGLERSARLLTGRPAETGNVIGVLQNGDEAYPRMIAAIDAAAVSIVLCSYIFRADTAGGAVIEALIRARQRGVQVRVLIDGIGGGYFYSPATLRLRRAKVRVGRFMHFPRLWRMPFINLRSHKKILCVDGRIAFTGGMNIADENVLGAHPQPRHPVQDTHFCVEGPVVAQLIDAFAEDWLLATGESLEGGLWFPPQRSAAANAAVARVITSGPDQDVEKIESIMQQAVACARHSLGIMTPYFVPDDKLISALALAALRGVAVNIVVPARGNHILIDWACRAQIEPLLRAGCKVWLGKPPFNHSKLMTVDGTWCLIGSANCDVRSLRLNFEVNTEVYHSDLAGQLDALMLAARATRLTLPDLHHQHLPIRLRNAAARLLLPYL